MADNLNYTPQAGLPSKAESQMAKTSGFDSDGMAHQNESIIQMASRQRKSFERRWYDNNFFDDGYHYRYVSRTTGKIVDISGQGNMHFPQRAIPKASRQIRGVANLLFANEPMPVVYPEKITQYNFPNPQEYEQVMKMAQDTASKISNWIKNEWSVQDLKKKLTQMIILTCKHGVSFLEVWPDPVKEEIRTMVYDAFDIYLKSTVTEIYDSPYIGKVLSVPIDEVLANEQFDALQRGKLNPDNRYAASEIKQAYMQSRFGYVLPTESDGTVLLKEFYYKEYITDKNQEKIVTEAPQLAQRKKPGDPVIRQVFSAGGVWLSDKYLDIDEYPFVDLRLEPGPIYQVPLIERFIPANKSLDSVMSRVERYIGTMITGTWLKRRNENLKVTNIMGGQVLEYDTVPPTQGNMASVPPFVFNFINVLESLIEEQGASTSSLAQIPNGVKAGVAIESLKASEYANLKIPTDQLKDCVKRITERFLQIADDYFMSPKTVQLLDQGHPNYFDVIGSKGYEVRKMAGEKVQAIPIKSDQKVDIEVESGLGFTEDGKRQTMLQVVQFIQGLAQAGYITQEAIQLVIKRFMEVFKFGNLQEFMEAIDTGTTGMPVNQNNENQIKIAVLQALKDAGEIGQAASEKRIQESKLGSMQAIVDSGIAQKQQPAQEAKAPSESISFKDLPPEGQAQMAQQAGIQLTPQVIQADQQQKQIQQTNQLANEAAIKGAYASQKGNQPSNSQ